MRRREYPAVCAIAIALSLAMFLAGCTVIRYVDKDKDDGGGGGGGGGTLKPKVVDVLVQANLRRPAANLASNYRNILNLLEAGLAKKKVTIRHVALAPMYRRHGDVVPLLWGRGAPDAQFGDLEAAIEYYTRDDGSQYLTGNSTVDGENLAALGMELDQRAIYRPGRADPESRAYFSRPKDGFVVLSLSAAPRRCDAGAAKCQLDGKHPAKFFTASGQDGAKWLELPGGTKISSSKLFYASVVTGEGKDYSTFAEDCRSQPKFPKTRLDVMEPSQNKYFGPFSKKVRNKGGAARKVGLCGAMSSKSKNLMFGLADQIRSSL